MNKILLIYICLIFTGCATYTGDKIIDLTSLPSAPENYENLIKTEELIEKLYGNLKLPEKRKTSIGPIKNYGLIQENKNVKFAHEKTKVFLIKGDIHVSFCYNSIIIATGNIDISHSNNNILVSGKNIKISHDRGGSIVVARGKVSISFADNTIIYAPGGLKTSHSNNMISYNTENRETSWGHVNNILMDPLFEFEKSFNKSIQPTANASAN